MSVFGNIDTKSGRSSFIDRLEHIETEFGRAYKTAMDSVIKVEYGRAPEYRPSSFPICPVLTYMKFVSAQVGHYTQEMGAGGGFFTSVGTAAHENIQYYMGPNGRMWGNWKCKNPRCIRGKLARDIIDEDGKVIRKGKLTRKHTTKHKCPSCDHPMEYVEIEINYKGLKGHIDAIYKMGKNKFWVGDYKTTTKNILKKHSKLPKREHLMQVPTYCYALEELYGMEILGFSLLYFSRDNPYEFVEKSDTWNNRWRAKIKQLIIDQKRNYRVAVRGFVKNKPELAIKYKPCQIPSDYEKVMPAYEPCPMENYCFCPETLKFVMTHKLTEAQIIKVVDITPNMSKYLEPA